VDRGRIFDNKILQTPRLNREMSRLCAAEHLLN
jgi:hypothetical protein